MASCCALLKGLERNVFVLPRERMVKAGRDRRRDRGRERGLTGDGHTGDGAPEMAPRCVAEPSPRLSLRSQDGRESDEPVSFVQVYQEIQQLITY